MWQVCIHLGINICVIGSVVVDGVRKSTRKRKNPYSKTEYVPVPKLEPLPGDSELEEDAEDWVSQ